MLLSLKYEFLFVHIAKTGGTSVRSALQKLRWQDPWFFPMWLCSRLSHLSGHRLGSKFPRHAKIIAAKEMLPTEVFEQLFKFTIVRNPWDLQVSSWHHLRRERPHLVEHCKDFDYFIHWKLDPDREYQFHIDTSIQFQSDFVVDLHGRVLTDFIGRYENLTDDFKHICQRIGVENRIVLPHKRKATDRKSDYRSYYSDELAEMIGAYFSKDIETLNYRFDPDELES